MIRNIVLFKLNEGVSRDSAEVETGLDLVEELNKRIPEIREWEIGWHAFDTSPVSYDWALNSLFDDTDAFVRFFNHPAHQAAIAHWKNLSTWVVVDMRV
jgi:hypothetical protein